MLEICCGVILLVLIIFGFFWLLGIGKKEEVKVVQTPPQVQKIYVKNCPKCGAENEAGNQFCRQCGNRF